MQILKSKYVFDGSKILTDTAIVYENKKVIAVIAVKDIAVLYGNEHEIIDFGDGVITRGFTDLQVNGIGGVAFNHAPTIDTLETMYKTNLKFGTLRFLPTMITCDFSNIIQALNTVKNWFLQYGNSRGVLGLHLEGPFLSPQKPGIHPKEYIIKPTHEYLEQIVNFRKYFPIKLTIAVEEFTKEQIEYLIDNQIILAIGHSNASYSVTKDGYDFGIKAITHTFNAMSGLSARNPGVIAAALNLPFYCGLIADLIHVESANIELLYKLKKDLIYLVSDSVTPTGTDISEFNFLGHALFVKGGKVVNNNGVLGGAYLTLNQAVKNCISAGIPLFDALKMAIVTPLLVMGFDTNYASIIEGSEANLVYLNLTTFNCKII